jgi:tetratricopeptide (TPR) repeat protein
MYYIHRSGGATGASVDRAIVFFEQAVNADPQFALAQAALGSAYSHRFFYFDADRQWEQKAFLAIEKALALEPDLAEAYLARGQLAWTLPNSFPHEKAVRDLQHAIAINPSLAEAHRELGKIYLHIGLLEKSIDANAQALRLDPGDGIASGRRVLAHIYLRQCAVALQLLDQGSIEGPGRFRTRALALMCVGRNDEALEAVSSANPMNENDQSLNALLLARTGKHDAARKQINQARLEVGNVQELSDRHHAQYYIGAAHALMGDTRQAVSWLKKASREGLPCYPLFERDPDLDRLRQDPEFAAFMAQLKAQLERFRATL